MPHEDPNVKEIDQFPNTPIKNTCPSLITIVLNFTIKKKILHLSPKVLLFLKENEKNYDDFRIELYTTFAQNCPTL